MELDEDGQHALSDLKDLSHQLGWCTWWDPACRGALGPDNQGGFTVATVDNLLELSPALCHKAEHLSFTKVLNENKEYFDS